MIEPLHATPVSTYRLQLHEGFTFADARAIVPYLFELGISHVYASPILRAMKGSTHGYDVVDPTRLNPELLPDLFDAFVNDLHGHGMALIVDVVPNHMSIGVNENAWWNDVLKHGRASRYAGFFDIAWTASHRPRDHDKVLLPVLSKPYGEAIEAGKLKLERTGDDWFVTYGERRFPIDPATIPPHLNASPLDLDGIDLLLSQQHYRLCDWHVASDELNYRRFFDVNTLAAVAMERQAVFDASHALLFDHVHAGRIDGMRIDHPDGLYDPKQYLTRLREHVSYVVVEKILAPDEDLPSDWPCDGTTGYDFLNAVNGLFVDPASEQAMTDAYADVVGDAARVPFAEHAREGKLHVLDASLYSEVNLLTLQLDHLAARDRSARDLTVRTLREALRETIANFPVYRSYISADSISDTDRSRVTRAIDAAALRRPDVPRLAFDFVRTTLLRERSRDADHIADQARFAGKFQQLTSPATAKGVEDTAFYRYQRLISLNEVGGDPGRFGTSPEELHKWFAKRQRHWPLAMNTLSTHDTKRSEDLRARINALSECPAEWADFVRRARAIVDDAVHPNDLYLLLQTLVGIWPESDDSLDTTFADRVVAFMQKSLREAKERSTWTQPDEAYECKVEQTVRSLLTRDRRAAFAESISPLASRVATIGLSNSLAQTLLKFTAPGVPDTYQGCELPDFSLVDPDNRRPVDFARRRALLQAADADFPKLTLTRAALAARRSHCDLFQHGEYVPLRVEGTHRLFAFARRHGDAIAVVVVPRLVGSFGGSWDDVAVRLPDGVNSSSLRWALTSVPRESSLHDPRGLGLWLSP